MSRPGRERRQGSRIPAELLSWGRTARLSPGLAALLVDVSSGGALVETLARLRPGGRTLLRLASAPAGNLTVACVVSRSVVAALEPRRGVVYRVALVFDEPLAGADMVGTRSDKSDVIPTDSGQ